MNHGGHCLVKLYPKKTEHLTFCLNPKLDESIRAYIKGQGMTISGFGELLFRQLLEGKIRLKEPSRIKYKHLASEVYDDDKNEDEDSDDGTEKTGKATGRKKQTTQAANVIIRRRK